MSRFRVFATTAYVCKRCGDVYTITGNADEHQCWNCRQGNNSSMEGLQWRRVNALCDKVQALEKTIAQMLATDSQIGKLREDLKGRDDRARDEIEKQKVLAEKEARDRQDRRIADAWNGGGLRSLLGRPDLPPHAQMDKPAPLGHMTWYLPPSKGAAALEKLVLLRRIADARALAARNQPGFAFIPNDAVLGVDFGGCER